MAFLTCGFAQRDVTPSLRGNWMDGYGFRMSPAEGIRDPLMVQVCAMNDGVRTHLIASIDLIGFSPRVYDLISAQVTAVCGIPAADMSLCCIHTHAAPVSGVLDELPMDFDYLAWVGEQIGRAALEAMEKAVPGHFAFDIPDAGITHMYNRRGRDVIDGSIRAASFADEQGVVRGIICSASCHAVINSGMTVSADYLSVLNAASTDDCPILFLQNRGADVDPMRGGELDTDTAISLVGHELTDPVLACAATHAGEARPAEEGSVTSFYEYVSLPVMTLDPAALADSARALEADYLSLDRDDVTKHFTLRELQWTRKMLKQQADGTSGHMTVPLQLVAFGKAFVFAFVPFEMLTLTGNALEAILTARGFDRASVFTVGYANSVNGYLAPRDEFPFGGYEVEGAAHWYGLPQNSPETEPAMLAWFADKAGML